MRAPHHGRAPVRGDFAWRERAESFTWTLEPQQTNTETHDVGFKLVPSFGNAHRLTGDPAYRDVLLARSLTEGGLRGPHVRREDHRTWGTR